jgi:hypothetical protein
LMAQFQNMPGNAQMSNPAAQHFQQQRAPPGSNHNNRNQSGSPNQQHNNLLNPNLVQFQGQGGNIWQGAGVDGLPDGPSPSDSWSTGSAVGQPVPATLNVEDWYVTRGFCLMFLTKLTLFFFAGSNSLELMETM